MFNSVFRTCIQLGVSLNPSRTFTTKSYPLYFHVSPTNFAEPLKKKKRIDPAIIKAREDRTKRRLEKQIRRLERNAQQLKPIEECEVPMVIINDSNQQRKRAPTMISDEEVNERILLTKKWAAYKQKKYLDDVQMVDRIVYSQQRALDELKLENEELYQAAIQIDEGLLPFKIKGPVETPPIKDYDSPDGEYIDISKKWDGS